MSIPAAVVYPNRTHSVLVGYLLLLTCVLGSHRFYFGKPITGTIWFVVLTSLLLLFHVIGLAVMVFCMLIDALLIPGMARRADLRYEAGPYDYNIAWILLAFFGWLGLHRFYLGKVFTGVLYLLTVGLCGLGVLYDFWTLNGQVSARNRAAVSAFTPPII